VQLELELDIIAISTALICWRVGGEYGGETTWSTSTKPTETKDTIWL